MIEIQEEQNHVVPEHVALLRVQGTLVLGEDIDAFRTRIATYQGERREVWLDLRRLSQIDAAGLGVLSAVFSSCQMHGTKLRLYDVSANAFELLRLVRLITILGPCVAHEIPRAA